MATSKIIKAMAEMPLYNKKIYKPTVEESLYWGNIIHKDVFKKKFKNFDSVEVRRRRGVLGECIISYDTEIPKTQFSSLLSLNHKFSSKKQWLNVIAHEFIHLWQWNNHHYDMKHDDSFYRWKPKLLKYGIELETEIED